MPRAEAGSAKAIGNAIKAKGLTKLRFYCQICEKACRDENGYKCHIESESHMRQIAALGNNAGKTINNFSQQFQDGFVQLLSRRFGTRRIKANQVYQEYIQERHHLHMNATRWVSLSEFAKHLGREGIAHVEEITNEGEHGWYLTWIDRSPGALARQDALQKMERAKMDEEGRMRKFLKDQIEKAKEQEEKSKLLEHKEMRSVQEGLQREADAAPLKIGLSLGKNSKEGELAQNSSSQGDKSEPIPSTSSQGISTPLKLSNPFKVKAAATPAPAAKFGGAFKTAASTKSNSTSAAAPIPASSNRSSSMTAAERIMAEEEEKKQKRKLMGPQPSAKRIRL